MSEGRRSGYVLATRLEVNGSRAWRVLGITIVTLLIGVVCGWVFSMPWLVYAVAVPLGIVYGLPAALGFALGGLFLTLFAGTAGSGTAAVFLGDLVLVGVAAGLWPERRPPEISVRFYAIVTGLADYVLTAVVALVCATAITGVSGDLLGRMPVVTAVTVYLTHEGVAVLALGPVVIFVLGTLLGSPVGTVAQRPRPRLRTNVGVGVVAAGWLAGSSLLSLLRQDVMAIAGAKESFAALLPVTIAPYIMEALGPQYAVFQAGVAVVASLLIGALLIRDRKMQEYSVR